MHTELNCGYLLHERELERDAHLAQGQRLRALSESDESTRGTLTSRWQLFDGVLRLRWNVAALRQGRDTVAEAA